MFITCHAFQAGGSFLNEPAALELPDDISTWSGPALRLNCDAAYTVVVPSLCELGVSPVEWRLRSHSLTRATSANAPPESRLV